jgi:hypothetical protein
MSDIRIEVFNGSYDNDDVYKKLLRYISNKLYCNGYGFNYDSPLSIIDQFRLSEEYSEYTNDQKMWHFIITFSSNLNHKYLLNMAVEVSSKFAADYQVMFGLDTRISDGRYRPHLHFAVNAFSYHPHTQPLTKDRIRGYMEDIQKFLSDRYVGEVSLKDKEIVKLKKEDFLSFYETFRKCMKEVYEITKDGEKLENALKYLKKNDRPIPCDLFNSFMEEFELPYKLETKSEGKSQSFCVSKTTSH